MIKNFRDKKISEVCPRKDSPPPPFPSKFDKTRPNPQGPLDTNDPPQRVIKAIKEEVKFAKDGKKEQKISWDFLRFGIFPIENIFASLYNECECV